jgi:uncharacterized membrane protein YfcA
VFQPRLALVNGTVEQILLSVALAVVAMAYAAVGQGGATGYIAVMGLVGFAPDVIRPAALVLNVLVSAIGTAQFARAGLLRWRTFYPFAVLGVPCSILGGATHLPAHAYHAVVGVLLLLAAWRLARSAHHANDGDHADPPPLVPSILAGAVVGFVAGITGIGGGILLAPLILARRWMGARETIGVSATFNLVNTAAALVGLWATAPMFQSPPSWWLLAVVCGGSLGSWLSVRGLPAWVVRYALAALLGVAGAHMLVS